MRTFKRIENDIIKLEDRIAVLEAARQDIKVLPDMLTNTAGLKCPLHEVGRMCRVFSSKPYKCDDPACIISGALLVF